MNKTTRNYMDRNCQGMSRITIIESLKCRFGFSLKTACRYATDWMTYK